MLRIYDVFDDLYKEAQKRKVLYNCTLFMEDAKRVLYLYYYWGYTYSQAIDETLNEIEEELIGLSLSLLTKENYGKEW